MSDLTGQPHGLTWVPDQLGRSLPIARGLRRSLIAGTALALLGLATVIRLVYSDYAPDVTPLPASEVERTVAERLADLTLTPWDPGAALSETELPPFVSAPEPTLWQDRHPGDPPPADPQRVAEARRRFAGGAAGYVAAATLFERAARANPSSWSLRYSQGISLYRAGGFHSRAAAVLTRALGNLAAYDHGYRDDPTHHAAAIATRYAASLANLRDDCVTSIRHLKLAAKSMGSFVNAEGALVFDRSLPFRLTPTPLDNYDIWNTLAQAYLECEGKYPQEYFARWTDGRRFTQIEYSDPDAAVIQDGPFPTELADCIANDGSSSRCWALSNLNRLYSASRQLLPADGVDPPAAFRDTLPSLARMAFNVALLAAGGPHPAAAVGYLQQAGRLNRTAPAAVALEGPITDLGRYLAPKTGDYAALAEPYRGRSVSELPFDQAPSPEALKGMAWALSERWQSQLEARQPGRMIDEIDAAVQRIPGVYLDSLKSWRREVHRQLQAALADEIEVERRKDNPATALAIRDFRADYLGDGWPGAARAAWTSWSFWTRVGLLVSGWIVLVAGLGLVYRFVIHPYLLYSTDYYRTEFHHRHGLRQKARKPFTGREIGDWTSKREEA